MKFLCLLLLLSFYDKGIVGENVQKDVPVMVDMNLEELLRPKVPYCKVRHGGDDAQYTLVVYVDKDECPSCFVADLAEWDILMHECRRQGLSLRFVFIFCVPSTRPSVFMATLSLSSISDVSYVDVKGKFARNNLWITRDRMKHVFLVGKERKPVFLSSPFDVGEIKRVCK